MDSIGSTASPDIGGLLRSTVKKNALIAPTSVEESDSSTNDPDDAEIPTDNGNSSAVPLAFWRLSFEDPRRKSLRSCLKKKTSSASSSIPKRVSFNESLNKTTYVR